MEFNILNLWPTRRGDKFASQFVWHKYISVDITTCSCSLSIKHFPGARFLAQLSRNRCLFMIIVAFLLGADLHAVALCCLLQVIAVAPKLLAGIFHEKLDWIKASYKN